MKTKLFAAGLICPLILVACGGGGESDDKGSAPPSETSPASDAPNTEPQAPADADTTPSSDDNGSQSPPTPAPAPAPVTDNPAPAPPAPPDPVNGVDIDMTAPFSQLIDCKVGRKPYYDPAISGNWMVSFDGDLFRLTPVVAGDSPEFGGRFSQLLLPERIDYAGSSLRRGYISAAGGAVYFVKDLTGSLLAAGDNEGSAALGRESDIECGGNSASEWLPEPINSPLRTVLTVSGRQWQPGTQGWITDDSIRLRCQSVEGGVYGTGQPATLSLNVDGSFAVLAYGSAELAGLSVAERAAATTGYYPIPRQAFASWYARNDNREVRIEFDRYFEGLSTWQEGELQLICRPSP